MITKNSLVALTLLTTITACGSHKSHRSDAVQPETNIETIEGLQPAETPKPAKPAETEKPAEETKPAETEKPAEETKPAEAATADIVGEWIQCEAIEIGSIGIGFTFKADGTVDFTGQSFADKECQSPYTDAVLAAMRQEWIDARQVKGAKASQQVAEQVDKELAALKTVTVSTGTYKIGNLQADQARDLDLTFVENQTAYTSYKIEGNTLKIADTCDAEGIADGNCTAEIGNTADTRATNFDADASVTTLIRK